MSAFFGAERQEPYTAAEHAAAEGHQDEYARDVPRTCVCTWQFSGYQGRYLRIRQWPECPFHADDDGRLW